MSPSLKKILKKLHLDRYLSAKIVLAMDLVVSTAASVLTMVMLGLVLDVEVTTTKFVIEWILLSFISGFGAFLIFKTYTAIIRHSTLRELGKFVLASMLKELVMVSYMLFNFWIQIPCNVIIATTAVDFFLTLSMLVVIRIAMLAVYDIVRSRIIAENDRKNVLIYGVDDKSVALAFRFVNSEKMQVSGFLAKGERLKGMKIANARVYYYETQEDVSKLYKNIDIRAILFASRQQAIEVEDELLKWLPKEHIKALIAPPLDEMVDGKLPEKAIRPVKIEDLLGREEIRINMDEIIKNFNGKVVMVTGAAGSIGSELCRQLATFGVERLVLFDNAETPMHNLRLELEQKFPNLDFVPIIGDVRHTNRLDYVFNKFAPKIVFHAAAYKHVPLMEENPCEAVLVNVAGTRFVADKCIEYGVEKMVMISTDKAVNPTNIMGCTKRLAEIYVQSLGLAIENGKTEGKTKFVTTRFGNVLGSNGSVIPLFRKQLEKGGPLTVTHPDITRFFMTIPEACRLVMEAATMTIGNQIFVFDMGKSVKIAHLAKRMIELAGFEPGRDIEIKYIGLRPGEKLYEEVLSNTENTLPTNHERIRIAKVRDYEYSEALRYNQNLEQLSREVDIPRMVKLMKQIVPEYISNNSVFEKFDKKKEEPRVS